MTRTAATGSTEPTASRRRQGVWWRPDRVSWWMGLLFAIGSLCFALAAIASQWASAPRPGIGVTYFVGSIFFTVAACLQWRSAPRDPRGIDWWASAIQVAGTLFFNVSTFAGMKHGFDARQTNLRVWTPDVFGSICFLVSSELAYAAVCQRWFCLRPRSLSWRIAALNLAGVDRLRRLGRDLADRAVHPGARQRGDRQRRDRHRGAVLPGRSLDAGARGRSGDLARFIPSG